MRGMIEFLDGIDLRFTLSLLSEGMPKLIYKSINEKFKFIIDQMKLFTIFPCSSIQFDFNENFDDDIIVFDKLEQSIESKEGQFLPPEETCFVGSQNLPIYTVSLYSKDAWRNSKSILNDFVQRMSHLSWLSVKPGSEKRTISYPPHIAALLRKNHSRTDIISKFEFLPSKEKI